MRIKYFGTAAAEGFPSLFCSCEACERARKAGGKNIRTRSQALIDRALLIDFPADTYMHVLHGGLDLREVKNLLITHSHEDHLYTSDFEYRKFGYAYFDADIEELSPITVYSSNNTGESIERAIKKGKLDKFNAFVWKEAKAFCSFEVDGYTVTPLEADHDKKTRPLMYCVEKDGKKLLYAHDTGQFPESTWQWLSEKRAHFNFVSLDCTTIINESKRNHMGIKCCEETRDRLLEIEAADEKTSFCLHHFSHNGKLIYDELKHIADEKGFLVSYDGAEFKI